MCELLGMSARHPTDICLSLSGLMARGGRLGPHRDGWGVAFYQGRGCTTFKEPVPGYQSPFAGAFCRHPIQCDTVVAHIRQANRGRVCLENTHPFVRELWGRQWSFAHNGQLTGYRGHIKSTRFRPVGRTDSEQAFCWMLDRLAAHYPHGPGNRRQAFRYLATCCQALAAYGICNILLSDGDYLLAHCGNRLHSLSPSAAQETHLADADWHWDIETSPVGVNPVTILATQPLSPDPQWDAFVAGEWRLYRNGQCLEQQVPRATG